MSAPADTITVPFPGPVVQATLVRRYKRFLLDAQLPDGQTVVAHCPNSGSLDGCKTPGQPVLLTDKGADAKGLRYSWQAVNVDGCWVGVNTIFANLVMQRLLEQKTLPGLENFTSLRREVPYGEENSRIDFLLENTRARKNRQTYLEVKNVTLRIGDEAQFPDAVTERGQKHLRELIAMKLAGHRAVLVFLVQRDDCAAVAPAEGYDPHYAALLRQAIKAGVEARAVVCRVNETGVAFAREIPVRPTSALPPQKWKG